MQNTTRTVSRSLLSHFSCLLLLASFCQSSQAQVSGPHTRESRFPKIRLQSANASVAGSATTDFYEEYIKGKTVIVNFFYTRCDQGVCGPLMSKLEKVQQLLGPRLGRDVFIVSITLDPEHDTPEVLNEYAKKIGAKPGWSFLRGDLKDITTLREKLGLANPSLDLIRRLNPVSPEVAAAGKVIEAKSPKDWTPKSLRALVGDRLVWRIGRGSAGKHGLRITNWENVKQFVEVEQVEGQEPFNATTGQNDNSTNTAGQVLLRLKIMSTPNVPSKIKYECKEQGTAMIGEVLLGQQHTGMLFAFSDFVNTPTLISADATPSEIENELARLGSAGALSQITVDAGPGVFWNSGGVQSKNLKVTAKKGQTLVFRQVDPANKHGIVFKDESLVLLKSDDPMTPKPNAVFRQTDDLRLYGTQVPAAPDREIASFEVIQDIASAVAFECTVHFGGMKGQVEQAPASGSAGALSQITVDAGPGVFWNSGGVQSKNLKVTAKKGQTLVFRQVDPANKHGIVFKDESLVLLKSDDPMTPKPNAVLRQTDDLRLYGTQVPAAPDREIASFEVIQDIASAVAFECTVHFGGMKGQVEQAPASGSATNVQPTADKEFLSNLSPSMQRRMLRFVNRAHVPEDLMKNPQEFRTRTEHAPAKLHERKSNAKLGFPRAAAEAVLASRPVNGFREVSECLPAYRSSDTFDELGPIIKSLGPTQFGKWELIQGGTPSVMHAALMNNGKVVFITDTLKTCVWDPAAAPVTLSESVTGLTDILYCSGQSFLSDGRLLAVGGGGSNPGVNTSIHAWKFDPVTQTWSKTAGDMSFQRWYPTAVTLGDEPGRVLLVAGDTGNGPAAQMEVYSETTDRFQKVTVTGRNLLFAPTYPGMHLLPAGGVLHVPTGFDDCTQSPSTGSADPTAIFTFNSPTSGSWQILGPNQRFKGMSTLLFDITAPFIQGLVVGGGSLAKNKTAQTIDLTATTPTWSTQFPLIEARIHPNVVQLPDGTVFICGGRETNPITPPSGGRCELFNPRTGVIAEMDEMIVPRHYHSVALLLPDGRVMAAGGGDDGGCTISTRNTIEVFSPPYLFKAGTRPSISSVKKFVEHAETFEIKTPTASSIQRVVLVRPMAVTHQTDSEQRVLQLSFQVTSGDTIQAQAPGLAMGGNPIAPRGHYMLFLVDQQGVPSVSKWVHLQ